MSWKEREYVKKIKRIYDLCITCKEDLENEGNRVKKGSIKSLKKS